jgi:hypothetical protein
LTQEFNQMSHDGTKSHRDRRSPADFGCFFWAVLRLGVWRDASPTDS